MMRAARPDREGGMQSGTSSIKQQQRWTSPFCACSADFVQFRHKTVLSAESASLRFATAIDESDRAEGAGSFASARDEK